MNTNVLLALLAVVSCAVLCKVWSIVGAWFDPTLLAKSQRTYFVEPSDTSKAIFLCRFMSRSFRLRLLLVSMMSGQHYECDTLVLVNVVARAYEVSICQLLAPDNAQQFGLLLFANSLELLNSSAPNIKHKKRTLKFLLTGLQDKDFELLFWVHHELIKACIFGSKCTDREPRV